MYFRQPVLIDIMFLKTENTLTDIYFAILCVLNWEKKKQQQNMK